MVPAQSARHRHGRRQQPHDVALHRQQGLFWCVDRVSKRGLWTLLGMMSAIAQILVLVAPAAEAGPASIDPMREGDIAPLE